MVVRDSGGSYGAALQKAIYTPFTQETGIQVKVLNLDDAPLPAQGTLLSTSRGRTNEVRPRTSRGSSSRPAAMPSAGGHVRPARVIDG